MSAGGGDDEGTWATPRCFTGAMLASITNPSCARVSNAQRDRLLIDHSGARNDVTLGRPIAFSAVTLLAKVPGKCLRREVVGTQVIVPVGADLVAGAAYGRDQVRVALGNPSQYEEGGADSGRIQYIQQPTRRGLNPSREDRSTFHARVH